MASLSLSRALRLSAAFTAVAFVSGCSDSNAVSESYLIKGNATKAQALEAIKPLDGIFYIFDFRNEKATFVVNDNHEIYYGRYGSQTEYPQRIFSVELSLADFPENVRAKYNEIIKFQSDVASNVPESDKQFAVWRASSKDPELNDGKRGALVVADPFSKWVAVVAVNGSGAELSGTVGDIKKYPKSVQDVYRRQLDLPKDWQPK